MCVAMWACKCMYLHVHVCNREYSAVSKIVHNKLRVALRECHFILSLHE